MNCIEMKWNEMDVVVDLRKGQRLCDTLNTTNATIKSKWLSFFSSCSLTAFWRDLQFPPLFFSYSSLQSFLLIVYFRQYSFFSLRITDIFIELTFYRRAFEIILKLKKNDNYKYSVCKNSFTPNTYSLHLWSKKPKKRKNSKQILLIPWGKAI